MKTTNYDIELMLPMQTDKDIIFNEAQNIFDSFCNYSVNDFIETPQIPSIVDKKFILAGGARQNQICFCTNSGDNWQYLAPKNGMVIFVQNQNSFFLFQEDNWQKIGPDIDIAREATKFSGVGQEYNLKIESKILYLYLNDHTNLTFTEMEQDEFVIIIKQNVNSLYKLTWPPNIVWPGRRPHTMTQTLNSIDMLKFYKLAESDKFLGHIIGQGYKE